MGDENQQAFTEEIATKSIRVESKLVYFSLRENDRGRYLKISEVGRNQRSNIIIPSSGWEQFRDTLSSFIEEGHGTPSGNVGGEPVQPRRRRDPSTVVCRRCRMVGHMVADCTKPKACYRCGSADHLGRDCTEPQRCHTCSNEGHIARDCPAAVALEDE